MENLNQKNRIYNSFLNLITGFGSRLIAMIVSFAVRTVFIRCLSTEYLGINGLYSNILSMLSLAELGFGTAMVFSMYKPLANKDYDKLSQILNLYKKVYTIIGFVVLGLGLSLIPFMDYLIKDAPNVDGLTFYYILFLLSTVVSYWFFAYKQAILEADQKAYIISSYNSLFSIIKSLIQTIVLLVFHSYTLYLITQIICKIIESILLAFKVKKQYPGIYKKNSKKLEKTERKKIFADVKALMINKVSHVALNSTDNIIISSFVGLKWVGLLSNYVLITDVLTNVLAQITSSIQASLGNFFVKEDNKAGYKLFLRVEFLNYWLYSFSMIALIVLFNPFITIWLGEEYTLNQVTTTIIAVNFFMAGFMNTLWVFRSTLGLFTQGKYRPIVVSILNIGLSIALSFKFGITGVLIATAISRLCVNIWYDPLILHKYGFKRSVLPFYRRIFCRVMLIVFITLITKIIADRVVFANGVTIITFLIMIVITAVLPNLILLIVFHRTDEFKYYKNIAAKFISKIKH